MTARLSACIVFAILTFPAMHSTLAEPVPRHSMQLDDIARILRVDNPAVSPDGQWVAYTVTSTDVQADEHLTHVWIVRWDGTEQRQLTFDPQTGSDPQWRPHSDSLSFIAKGSGKDEGQQIWLLDHTGGKARQLTHITQSIEDYCWSPDGSRLLLTLQDRTDAEVHQDTTKPRPMVITRYQFKADGEGYLTDQRNHLYLFDAASMRLMRLIAEDGRLEEGSAAWSPDGKQIAFLSQRAQPDPEHTENEDIFVTDAVANSTPRRITRSNRVIEGPLAWSPDSQTVAFRQARFPGYSSYTELELAILPSAGGSVQVLTGTLDRPVGNAVFVDEGRALLTSVVDDRNVYAERVPVDDGLPSRLTKEVGVVDTLASNSDRTVVKWSTDTTFPELYAMEAAGKLRQLTHHNDALLATLQLVPAKNISAKGSDGKEVHGLLTLPCGYSAGKKTPLLLSIHGGPTSQDAHEFDLSRQLFAAHGYAVLQVNYRGSNGRGFQFGRDIQADWGNKEVSDLLAVLDAAIATKQIDPGKLVVGGWSYGGILTDALITRTNRFKAASAGAGRANLIGVYGANAWVLQYDQELGQPWKNPALYIKLSYPFFHADRIRTPTLFMGGDRDFNVPIAGSEQMYEALRSTGTQAELIVYPGQFHGFSRPSFIVDRYRRWFDWYDSHLAK